MVNRRSHSVLACHSHEGGVLSQTMIFRSDLSLDRGMAAMSPRLERLWGFRRGHRGTHSSRTIMLDELTQLLEVVPSDALRDDYAEAVVAGNCLGKPTAATRKASFQRLAELYGLHPRFLLFRALRLFWRADEAARPALALLLALARDPLLRASVHAVVATPIGRELNRQSLKDELAAATQERLNPATLDAVVRNAASSWTQAGYLRGRSRKTRQRLGATPAATAYALLIDSAVGNGSDPLYDSPWVVVLDVRLDEFVRLVEKARVLGHLEFKHVGKIMELSFPAITTEKEREIIRRESHR